MTLTTRQTQFQPAVSTPTGVIGHGGVCVPCVQGYHAFSFRGAQDIPFEIANALPLEHARTQVETYARLTAGSVDATAHIRACSDNLEKHLPPKGSHYLVWSEDGGLVGTGAMRKANAATAEMKNLYVRPEARGFGLGRWLVEQRIRDAQMLGLTEIQADTLRGNEEMPALYLRLGFEEVLANDDVGSLKIMPHLADHIRFFRKTL